MSLLGRLLFLALLGVGFSGRCPDDSSCEEGHTCCDIPSPERFACCPLPDAVCCGDGHHCCPSGTTCHPSGDGCLEGDGEFHLEEEGEYQYCPDGAACPASGTTCCPRAAGGYACCPYPDGVCCEDMETCCQAGEKCEGGRCVDDA